MRKVVELSKAVFRKDVKGRMLRGTFSNVYDKNAVLLTQLLTIPILTQYWGVDGYGLWLILMTLPTYIALSDMGVGTAAAVMLTEAVEKKNYDKAISVLQSTIAIVMGAVLIVCLFIMIYLGWYWSNGQIVAGFSSKEIVVAATFMVGYSLIFTQMNVITAVWRATHKYASAMVYAGTFILIEGGALVILAMTGKGLIEATFGFFIIRLVGYIIFLILLKRKEPWVKIRFSHVTKQQIKELFSPSIAALALIFALALSVQGTTLLVGSLLGAAAVGIYGAARTLSRAPLQLAGLVIRPSIPELTRAYAQNNENLIRSLNQLNLKFTLLSLIPLGGICIIWGSEIVSFFSQGRIVASKELFCLLFLAVLFHGIWNSYAAALISINKQKYFTYHYFSLVVIAMILIFILDIKNIEDIALMMIFPEFLILIFILKRIKRNTR